MKFLILHKMIYTKNWFHWPMYTHLYIFSFSEEEWVKKQFEINRTLDKNLNYMNILLIW